MINYDEFKKDVEDAVKSLLLRYLDDFKYGELVDYKTKEIVKRKGKPNLEDFIKWLEETS